ncbi:MAG TPA: VTT domain-containing protein [Candidatus Eisenbacteria bacterium]
MDELLHRLSAWAATLSPVLLLLVAFAAGVIETIFPPFPSDSLLIALSFTAARGTTHPVALAVSAALGSFLSLYLLYLAGRSRLEGPVRRLIARLHLDTEARLSGWFARWGYLTILASRFLPGIRGPITFLAGTYGLRPARMAAALLASCLLWNAAVVLVGWVAGRNWDGSAGGLGWIGLAIAVWVSVAWLGGAWALRRGASTRR